MQKQQLVILFPLFSKKRAFRDYGDGFEVVGKYVRAVKIEGTEVWDVFVCNTAYMASGLGTGFINNRVATFPNGVKHAVLDGEAWFQGSYLTVRAWLETHRSTLDVQKRRPPPHKNTPRWKIGRTPGRSAHVTGMWQ